MPEGKRLIEPFAGSGAVFLNTSYERYLLGDTNSDLIQVFKFVQTQPLEFIAYCKTFFTDENNEANKYYALRDLFNSTDDAWLKAALFIYMNKHCYNGLCRYNRQGKFNSPFGKYKKPYFPEAELYHFSLKAKNAQFEHCDFLKTMAMAEQGDVVYCDPPYVPWSLTANFTSYQAEAFSQDQQALLAAQAKQLAARGVAVIVSNHYSSMTESLYDTANIQVFPVMRNISCIGEQRRPVQEMLAIFSEA